MKKEMNNKGFSLVELIIVIAIMVILIAVLAPQYLKYVEKSRVASDTQTVVEFINSLQVLAADPDIALKTTETYTVTSGTNVNTLNVSADLRTQLQNAGQLTSDDFDGSGNSTSKLQSSGYVGADIEIKLVYDAKDPATGKGTNTWHITTKGVDSAGKLPE
ncbi:MAG: prepilin-type N-terminal cleavage/methylation domain-containing protein [Butyrivibrio sp.]|nr:prepilin-type N-terminal cleavage/methylation domain-containing protein [Butyrivibrio sp.]